MTPGQHLLILTAMTLRRSHEADAAVAVFVVVPADKITHPAARSVSTSAKPSLGHYGQYFRVLKEIRRNKGQTTINFSLVRLGRLLTVPSPLLFDSMELA
jgi:hypothetical protein